MIIYEVNLSVDAAVRDAFRAWLEPHIDEIVAIDGFTGATWYERDPADEANPGEPTGAPRVLWTVHYRCESRARLEAYFRDHAPRLREDGLSRFPGQFTATRRVLRIVADR